ncbi:hypothetical protein AB1Y20_007002 [Prymnesium parvum]|uniref:Rhodanese domain-containing protein n=1 Tax=Prymnesium parvum TaxID=97485 RepID=A0AB34J024_PRYPA
MAEVQWAELSPADKEAWLLKATHPSHPGLIDVRPAAAYARRHLAHASSFPLASLPSRTAELPPQSAGALCVVGMPGDELASALAFLRGRDGSRGWAVALLLPATEELWRLAVRLSRLEANGSSRRLWAPSPHLPPLTAALEPRRPSAAAAAAAAAAVLFLCSRPTILRGGAALLLGGAALAAAAAGRRRRHALDLGCGRGRDCVWLALRGWSVVGVDCQPAFLREVEEFARRAGVGGRVRCELRDLKKRGVDAALFQPAPQLINVSRFMSRALLDDVVAAMPVGCVLAVHHFTREAVSLKSGRPIKGANEDERGLAPGELRARYAGVLDDILLEETVEGIDGRMLCNFAARKSGSRR